MLRLIDFNESDDSGAPPLVDILTYFMCTVLLTIYIYIGRMIAFNVNMLIVGGEILTEVVVDRNLWTETVDHRRK